MDNTYFSVIWNMSINGNELDQERRACIISIDIDERCDGSDTAEFTVADPDFKFIEDNIFIEESTVYISMIFDGDLEEIKFNGYISAIDIDFPESGTPTLSIFCMDGTHIMNREKKKRTWDNVTNFDVVQKIVKEYGFKIQGEPGYNFLKEVNIAQSDQTDIEFIESLAKKEREQFMCKLVGDTFHYRKKGLLEAPIAELSYKTGEFDLVNFSPSINKETRQEKIDEGDITPPNKENDIHQSKDSNTNRETQGEPVKTSSNTVGKVYDLKNKRNWGTVKVEE